MELKSYQKYDRAKKRVKEIRDFYNHLKVFVIIMILLLIGRFYALTQLGFGWEGENFENWLDWNTYLFPAIWALVILFHGIKTYNPRILRGWEEKKIKQYMDKEDQESKQYES